MTTSIILSSPNADFMPPAPDTNQKARISRFIAWLDQTNQHWFNADLNVYLTHLQTETALSAQTTQNYLSTVRMRYKKLMEDNGLRVALYQEYEVSTPETQQRFSPKEYVDERLTWMTNNCNTAPVKVPKKQDYSDEEHRRLTVEQGRALIDTPVQYWHGRPQGIRDRAIIALLLCTGIRREELCNLEVRDLRQRLDGALALQIREGKGMKQRLVVYGAMADYCLPYVDEWLEWADIGAGIVFRGLKRNSNEPRGSRLNAASINKLFDMYTIPINGELITINPHDTRRTYARWMYDSGMPVSSIKEQLGHESESTTWGYIGKVSTVSRTPLDVFNK